MFDRYAGRLYDYLETHHRTVRRVILVLVLASLAGLFFVKYESSMDEILPKDEVITRTMDFFRHSEVTGKVVISLGLTDSRRSIDELLPVADIIAASLDRRLFPEVQTGLSEARIADDMEGMLGHLPAIISRDDLDWIESRMTRQRIAEKLRGTYIQLLKPEGMFLGSMVRADPLGLKGLVLQRVSSLSSALGYDVSLRDGHFVSSDGRHAMIIARSAVPVVDAEGAKKLLTSLNETLGGLPPFVSADVISGHSHTVSNERLIKGDITFISAFATFGFLLLYLVIIRDFRTVLIFLVPVIAILISINLSALVLGSISYWVIGLGSTVAGITIDYGTHVYFAVSGKKDPRRLAKQVIRPVAFGAITTVAVFAAFFASSITGYARMAVFSIICVILSTVVALFVLPHMLTRTGARHSALVDRAADLLEHRNWSRGTWVVVWLLATAVLAYYAIHVEFERDIKRVDGTEQSILQAEERFHRVWGGERTPAVLVVRAPDYERALDLNEQAFREAVRVIGRENVTSIAPLLPSLKTRQENERRWKTFWSAERRQNLRTLLVREGMPYGFSENAFDPFFSGLDGHGGAGGDPPPDLTERFIQKTSGGYQALSFFPDRDELVTSLGTVIAGIPGAYLVSGSVLSERISREVADDMKTMTAAAALLVLLLTYAAFRTVRETVIAMVPPLTSVIWLLGIMEISGMTVNVANMIAGVLVIGLASDYGIFMVFRSRDDVKAGTVLAITLCTLTTVIGAGVLIFARHPALSSVGITMVIGTATGYLATLLVVPKLCDAAGIRAQRGA